MLFMNNYFNLNREGYFNQQMLYWWPPGRAFLFHPWSSSVAVPRVTLAHKHAPLLLVSSSAWCRLVFVIRAVLFGSLKENSIPKAPHWCSLYLCSCHATSSASGQWLLMQQAGNSYSPTEWPGEPERSLDWITLWQIHRLWPSLMFTRPNCFPITVTTSLAFGGNKTKCNTPTSNTQKTTLDLITVDIEKGVLWGSLSAKSYI